MIVEQIMKRPVKACSSHDLLHTAAKIMWDFDCGCVPVVDGGKVVGMLTDRDICMAAYLQGGPLTAMAVSTAMSRELFVCRPTDPVATAEAVMQEHHVRRLPVVDDEGRLVGMLSLSDLAVESARERRGKSKRDVSADEVVRTLGSVCEPRRSTTRANAGDDSETAWV